MEHCIEVIYHEEPIVIFGTNYMAVYLRSNCRGCSKKEIRHFEVSVWETAKKKGFFVV